VKKLKHELKEADNCISDLEEDCKSLKEKWKKTSDAKHRQKIHCETIIQKYCDEMADTRRNCEQSLQGLRKENERLIERNERLLEIEKKSRALMEERDELEEERDKLKKERDEHQAESLKLGALVEK
jgi:chromosome segregation ATPase